MIYPLASSDGLHVTLILVRLICSARTLVGAEATEVNIISYYDRDIGSMLTLGLRRICLHYFEHNRH